MHYNWKQDTEVEVNSQILGLNVGGDFGGGTVTLYERIEGTGFQQEIPLQDTANVDGEIVSVPLSFNIPFTISVDNGGRRKIIIRFEGSSNPDLYVSLTPYINDRVRASDPDFEDFEVIYG